MTMGWILECTVGFDFSASWTLDTRTWLRSLMYITLAKSNTGMVFQSLLSSWEKYRQTSNDA
jgi:hypothetical protein